MSICEHDRQILRGLAAEVREVAELPEMTVRKQRWYDHNALRGQRPMVLCFPEGAWGELIETPMQCQDEKLRNWEWHLRAKLYWWKSLRDDHVIEPYFDVMWEVTIGDFGVAIPMRHGENRGSYRWDPPIKDLERDLGKLHIRPLSVDRAGTERKLAMADELFGDLLPPRLRGGYWWTQGLTADAIRLLGLEPFMMAMYDNPQGLHRLMAFLRDDAMHLLEWSQEQGVLTWMNGPDYTGSGGVGYTHELPGRADDLRPRGVRLEHLWGFAESQETVGVSPQMFEEFVLPYQKPMMERFGLNCYGCCEGVHQRIDAIMKHIPRLRRVSVSPWCDQAIMAEKLSNKCIFSRKPNPAMVCASWDEGTIRQDLRQTLRVAGGGALEIIMKDTHTVQHEPWRLQKWVRVALEEVERYMEGRTRN
jgi:hypothetical protein